MINKKIKDADVEMFQAISQTYTGVLEFVLKNSSKNDEIQTISECLDDLFEIIITGVQASQVGASMCISKIIQSAPINSINALFENTLNKILAN